MCQVVLLIITLAASRPRCMVTIHTFFWKWIQNQKKWGWKDNKPWANSHIKLFAMLACAAIHTNVLFVSCWTCPCARNPDHYFCFWKSISKGSFMFALLYSISWFDGIFFIFILKILNPYHVLRPSITAGFWPLLSEVLRASIVRDKTLTTEGLEP